MKTSIVRHSSVVSLILVLFASLPALAQDASYVADLSTGAGSTAHCGASFSYDDLGRQLTYRLTCDGLSSPATLLHVFGPTQFNIDMLIEVHSTPIIGTASLSDNEATALKAGSLTIAVQTVNRPQGEVSGRIAAK